MDKILQYELFYSGNFSLTVSKILYLAGLFLGCWLMLIIVEKLLGKYKKFDEGQRFTIYTIVKYFLYTFVISASFKFLGIDVTVLIAGSAAFFVGIGLGLQGLFYDFISGIILLVEGTIKVGNVIQIGEKRVEIVAIRFRTSVVKTRDEKEIIVPNSNLIKNEIINWSNQKNRNRHEIILQVSEKDVEKAMDLMRKVVQSHQKVAQTPEPYTRIEDFNPYSISIKVLFWSDEVFTVGRMLGEIRLLLLQTFQENQIKFPIPQQSITIQNIP